MINRSGSKVITQQKLPGNKYVNPKNHETNAKNRLKIFE